MYRFEAVDHAESPVKLRPGWGLLSPSFSKAPLSHARRHPSAHVPTTTTATVLLLEMPIYPLSTAPSIDQRAAPLRSSLRRAPSRSGTKSPGSFSGTWQRVGRSGG